MNKWKIAAWISWGVIMIGVVLGIILYLPGRVKVIENAEKIDNLTWQYQFVSVLYEQSQIESELYKMNMIGCYNLRQEYRDNEDEKVKKVGQKQYDIMFENIQSELDWLSQSYSLSALKSEAINATYERIYSELHELGVSDDILNMMNEDMPNRISKSLSNLKTGITVLPEGWDETNLFTINELWVTRDKNGNFFVFLDEPYIKDGLWYSENGRWGVLTEGWRPAIEKNGCKHFIFAE
jgi:hypothetical protein